MHVSHYQKPLNLVDPGIAIARASLIRGNHHALQSLSSDTWHQLFAQLSTLSRLLRTTKYPISLVKSNGLFDHPCVALTKPANVCVKRFVKDIAETAAGVKKSKLVPFLSCFLSRVTTGQGLN